MLISYPVMMEKHFESNTYTQHLFKQSYENIYLSLDMYKLIINKEV